MVRARVGAVAEASAVMIHDDVPPELADELAGHVPVLRRLGDGIDLGLQGRCGCSPCRCAALTAGSPR